MTKCKTLSTIKLLFFLAAVCSFSSVNLKAQFDVSAYESIKEQYPEESIVKLNDEYKMIIKLKKDKPDIKLITKERILFLKNNKGFEPEYNTFTSSLTKLIDYEANSYVLQNGKYKKLPVKDYKEQRNIENSTFFDDVVDLIFTYPGVTEGTVMELNTVHQLTNPYFLASFPLQGYIPIIDLNYEIICDKNVNIDLIPINFNDKALDVQFRESGNKKIYIIKRHNIDNIKKEKFLPNTRYFTEHVIPIINSYTINNQKFPVLENLDDLHKLYYDFISDVDKNIDTTTLNKVVSEIISDDMSEIEKVEKLYQWVQTNIKYIAFEDDMSGFIPDKPDAVLKKRYGDCKGKTSILHALLEQAGIKSYFTWVGSRDIPYTYTKLSSPLVDNHMILTYVNKEDYYFLDGTGRYQTINLPTSFIQGKEAFINIDKDNYEVKKIPVISSDINKTIDSVEIKIAENKISGHGTKDFQGLIKVAKQYRLNIDNKKDQKELLDNILELGNNNFVLTDYSFINDNDFDSNFVVGYDFTLDRYINTVDNEIFINLNLDKSITEFKIDKDKIYPMELNNAQTWEMNFILEIPEGYKVAYLPEKVSGNFGDFGYELEYIQQENKITYMHDIWINKIYFNKESFNNWQIFIASLEKTYKETIILER